MSTGDIVLSKIVIPVKVHLYDRIGVIEKWTLVDDRMSTSDIGV